MFGVYNWHSDQDFDPMRNTKRQMQSCSDKKQKGKCLANTHTTET